MARWLKDPFTISLILVVIVSGIIAWFKFKPVPQNPPPYLGASANNIDKVVINFQEDKTVLKKNNNQWAVENKNNQPADQQLVEDLLAKLEKLKPTELVAQNADNHSKYGVDQTQAIRLLVYQNGQKKLELLVGNSGPSFNKNYVRKHSEEKVYLSNVSLRSTLIPTDTWVKSPENQEKKSTN